MISNARPRWPERSGDRLVRHPACGIQRFRLLPWGRRLIMPLTSQTDMVSVSVTDSLSYRICRHIPPDVISERSNRIASDGLTSYGGLVVGICGGREKNVRGLTGASNLRFGLVPIYGGFGRRLHRSSHKNSSGNPTSSRST